MILSDLSYRLRALFRRRRMEEELDEELRFHVAREAEKYRRAGMSEDEAQRRARMVFGGHEQIKENVREARGTSLVEQFGQDVYFAARMLTKNLGFTTTAVLTLALGIGASAAACRLADAVLS